MKIDQFNGINNARQTQATDRTKPARPSGPLPPIRTDSTKPSSESDAVYISERAETIAQLVGRVAGLGDVRQERVESLRAIATSGEFRPSAEEIADSIIRDEVDFSR